MVNIFILQKISPERDRVQLFCTFAIILDKFSAPTSSNFFLWKIWVITNSKSAPNITWWVFFNEKQGPTFANFVHFFYPVTLLTHSALARFHINWFVFSTKACKNDIDPENKYMLKTTKMMIHTDHCDHCDMSLHQLHLRQNGYSTSVLCCCC